MPFLIVDDDYFEHMIQTSLQPAFKIFLRQTAKRDCMKIFSEERENLKKIIKK